MFRNSVVVDGLGWIEVWIRVLIDASAIFICSDAGTPFFNFLASVP
jgi:hypothetical protein